MKRSLLAYLVVLAVSVPILIYVRDLEMIDAFGNTIQLGALAFAAICFWRAAQANESGSFLRSGCEWLAFGLSIWGAGQIMITYSETLLHRSPYGTVSSTFFVAGYLFHIAAVVLFVRQSFRYGNGKVRRSILHGCILFCLLSIAVVSGLWHKILDPQRDWILRILDLTYPEFDIGIAAFLTVPLRAAWRVGDSNSVRGYALLATAFIVMALVDIVLTDVEFTAILYRAADLMYFSSYFLIACSGMFLAKATQVPDAIDATTR